jgi:hypothetical protein
LILFSKSVCVIVFPVIGLIKGIACKSLRLIPISLGDKPSFDNETTREETSEGVIFSHEGELGEAGRDE